MSTIAEIRYNTLRSLLFVPALNDRFIASAHTRSADGIVLDLEDSIIPERKADARAALDAAVKSLQPHGLPLFVRINNVDGLREADLRSAVQSGADALLIPKIDTADMLHRADEMIRGFEGEAGRPEGSVKYIALIESPLGVLNLQQIVTASPRLRGLGFGVEDYAALLGVDPTPDALSVPAQMVAIAARAYDLAAWGIAGSIGDFNDTEGFLQLVRRARTLGFTGTLGIHPKQIGVINAGFRPSEQELELARRIIEAFETAQRQGSGAVALDGKMIDVPIVERARRLLES